MVLTATIIKLCCFDAREGSAGDGEIERKGCRGCETKRIAGMVERSHGTVTKVLHFHDRTSSDMFSLMFYLCVS